MDPTLRKSRAALISVGSNTVLVLAKLAVGVVIGSVSVISEAVHSAVDLLAAIIALVAVRRSGRPADEGHAFGHGKLENLSGLAEALLIFVAAGWIVWEAVDRLLHPAPLDLPVVGVLVMAVSAGVNVAVSRHLFRVGRETSSQALLADAWHLRTDVWTSLGVMVGLGLVALGAWFLPGADLHWLDPAVALGVALLIVHAAWRLTVESGRDLLDQSLPADERAWIRARILEGLPQVRSLHRLRTRRAGAECFVDFHLVVDASLTVAESHAIADRAEALIRERYPRGSVVVHVEPCEGACSQACQEGCTLPPGARPPASTLQRPVQRQETAP